MIRKKKLRGFKRKSRALKKLMLFSYYYCPIRSMKIIGISGVDPEDFQ